MFASSSSEPYPMYGSSFFTLLRCLSCIKHSNETLHSSTEYIIVMGAGAGHMAGMIASLKANKALKKSKGYYNTMKDYVSSSSKEKLTFKKATKKEMEAIKAAIKLRKEQDKKKQKFVILFTIVITVLFFWFCAFFVKKMGG